MEFIKITPRTQRSQKRRKKCENMALFTYSALALWNKHRICGIKDWQVGVEKKDSRNLFWTPKTVTHSTDLQLLTKKMLVQRKQEEIKTILVRDLWKHVATTMLALWTECLHCSSRFGWKAGAMFTWMLETTQINLRLFQIMWTESTS